MRQLLVITGQLRSGTSAVSEVCHTLGVSMGHSFLAPMAPTYRLDWEDSALSMRMMRGILKENPIEDAGRGLDQWLAGYIVKRWQEADSLAGIWDRPAPSMIGMKQPLLALFMPAVRRVSAALGMPVIHIGVTREAAAIERSVLRSFPPPLVEAALAINSRIAQAPPVPFAVPYEDLVDDRRVWVDRIASTLGISDQERIGDAAVRVKGPTS